MKADLKRKWVEALRSGKYKQGFAELRGAHGFCCLGVLADIQGVDWKHSYPSASRSSELLCDEYAGGLSARSQTNLATMNDGDDGEVGMSFPEIADWIEENIPEES